MYEQGMSLGQSIAYVFGGIIALICAAVVSSKIARKASVDQMFFYSKSAAGSQAVVFNLGLYVVALGLLLKGFGLDV